MAENLMIVESPAKAGKIQKFLGASFKVMSSYGHIRDLKDKELSIDTENSFKPEYIIPAAKKKVVADLKAEAAKAGTVWLASDEDREGEAIAWHICSVLGLEPANTNRIVFHEITENAIKEAVLKPRRIDLNLVDAQQARRVLDRLVGYELSPVLWRKIQRGLSAGRVQSVALRLVVDREREIMAFESEAFYRVEGNFKIDGTPVKGILDSRFECGEQALKFLDDSIGASYCVESAESKEGVRSPQAPFTTSTLQQEAARKLHFPVGVTMRTAQSLYERGLITYMRTDSTNLSALAVGTAKQFIIENFGGEYSRPRQYRTRSKGAQEAHEAIRPTYIANTAIEGSSQEQKLYSLIWKRTLASQMSDAKVLNTVVKVKSDRRPEKFVFQATGILFDGFLKLYNASDRDEDGAEGSTTLPELKAGDVLVENGIVAECKYSQPPVRYSEGSLVKKLEELGIGRPSTYEPTISTLTKGRGYIVKSDKEGRRIEVVNYRLKGGKTETVSGTETIGAEKGKLVPQEKGMIVVDYLNANFAEIMDYNFTAGVEEDFDRIAEGEKGWQKVISDFYSPFHAKIDSALSSREFNHVEREIGIDPSDGSLVTAKYGQYGPYVQKGEGANRVYASLAKGQLIENISLEEALRLFSLPRIAGQVDGVDVVVAKGRFGPFLKFGDKNISLPKGADPFSITLAECEALIRKEAEAPASSVIKEFESSGISIISGRYGPYLKCNGSNFRLPAGTDANSLDEEACKAIVAGGEPTRPRTRKFRKTK